MYGKKKSPVEKRSCYKMTPKSPILRALEKAAPTKYMNKKTKNNKPCPGCGTICPSCRGKK